MVLLLFRKTDEQDETTMVNFLTNKGWRQFTSGFIVGGFGGAGIAYALLKVVSFDLVSF